MPLSELFRSDAMKEATIPEIQYDYEYDFVLHNLGIELPEIGTVLELSASQNATFQNETSRQHPGLTVVSLDPSFSNDNFRANYLSKLDDISRKPSLVAGIAQEMPFTDNTFDLIVSHCGVPTHLPDSDNYPNPHHIAAFKEAYRVLKPGGLAVFAPIFSVEDLEKCFDAIDTFNTTEELIKLTYAEHFLLNTVLPEAAYRLIMTKATDKFHS